MNKKTTGYAPNLTMEQWEAIETNVGKKYLSSALSRVTDRGFSRAYSKLSKALTSNRIRPVSEDGEFWIKIVKADMSTLSISDEEESTITSRLLQVKKRGAKRIVRKATTQDLYEWVCVGFDGSSYYAWQHEEYICEVAKQEVDKLVEWLQQHFSSKYTNGKLLTY